MGSEIRRPIEHRQGLTARLNALGKIFGTQKAVAAALGVAPSTLRRWKAGTVKVSDRNLRKVEGTHNRLVSLPNMRKRLKSLPPPNSVEVTATIIWNGYKNRTEDRTTTLGGMARVMAQVIRTWATAGPQAAAQVFEKGAATVHNTPKIEFAGDAVTIDFPWENR